MFEVEGQLQIRPDQYHHARELLSHPHNKSEPGPITQLNMGEGKTRVILPMLAMEWADGSCVVSFPAGPIMPNLLPASALSANSASASLFDTQLVLRRDIVQSISQQFEYGPGAL